MYIRSGCEKDIDLYRTGVTDQHMVQFKSHEYLICIHYVTGCPKTPRLEYMQLVDIMYVRNGCETTIIPNSLTVKHMLW
jgi:hypothetical protein